MGYEDMNTKEAIEFLEKYESLDLDNMNKVIKLLRYGEKHKEMIKEDLKNLIFELENAEMKKDGKIGLVTATDNGTTNYMGYSSFKCFCDGLICKYLSPIR